MAVFEIELRYKILSSEELSTFLISFKQLHQKHDVDIYLDTPQALLYQKGIFIRIRNNSKLDIKFNRACLEDPELALQDYCEEHSFQVPLQESEINKLNFLLESLTLKTIRYADLEHFKNTNNFETHYIVNKIRTTYTDGFFTLGIDHVEDLGTFLEIEFMADSLEDLAAIKQQMQQLLKPLSLEPLRTGYGTLLLRKQNFKHYLLGRFILEEDKVFI